MASQISKTIEYLSKKKVKVGVNDIHASCVRTFEEKEKLIEEIKEKTLLLLENLIGKVISAIYESLKEKETKEIILIAPNECFQKGSYKNLRIKRYKYVPYDEFRDILSRVLFTVSFVSHTTIEVYSILNGIPFLSIYSSRFSTDIPWMDKIFFPLYLSPFESLGQIEGDVAWRGLFSNNPYFEAYSIR